MLDLDLKDSYKSIC